MAIADRLNKLRTDIEDTYQAINNLGGTIPSDKNTNNIPEAIRSVYDNLPKVSDTGTNVSLSPTLKGRLGIVPKGNTLQDGTPSPSSPVEIQSATGTQKVVVSGKNILPITLSSQTINGLTITKNSDGSITLNGTTTATFNIEWKTNNITLPAGTYYIGLVTTTNSFNLYFNKSGGGFEVLGNPASSSYYTLTLNEETTYTGLKSYVGSGITFNNVTFYPMITKTLPFNYQSYQEPQEVDIELGSRNYFNPTVISNSKITISDDNTLNVSDVGGVNGYCETGKTLGQLCPDLKVGDTVYLYIDTDFYFSGAKRDLIYCRGNWNNGTSRTITQDMLDGTVVVYGGYGKTSHIKIMVSEQLETDYTPYYNYTLNKIGDYEDYIDGTPDNWVLYKNIGKVVLNGSESLWGAIGNNRYYLPFNDKRSLTSVVKCAILSNYFKPTNNAGDTVNVGEMTEGYYTSGNKNIFFNYNGSNNDLAGFKTWLSTHNTELLYVLAETQQTPITEEPLVSQLNELYYLQSYNDTTNIDVTGNLPMRITASAIKGA